MHTNTSNALQSKLILVTGATDGIGREAAMHYALAGAEVILVGRHLKRLEATFDSIINAGGTPPIIHQMNLATANPDQYQQLADHIQTNYGQLDGLLHNAATLGGLTPIEHYDIKQWYEVFQVNCHARFLLTRALLPCLRKSKSARIIFTNATTGIVGKAYWGAYSCSEFANQGLMQILADELENTPIKINCINPGPTRTKLRARAYPGENSQRLPHPKELMPVYLSLMGSDGDKFHGQTIDARRWLGLEQALNTSS